MNQSGSLSALKLPLLIQDYYTLVFKIARFVQDWGFTGASQRVHPRVGLAKALFLLATCKKLSFYIFFLLGQDNPLPQSSSLLLTNFLSLFA